MKEAIILHATKMGRPKPFYKKRFTFVSDCPGFSTRVEISGKLVIPQPNVEAFKQMFYLPGT